MRKVLRLLAIAVLSVSAFAQTDQFVLQHVNVIDVRTGKILADYSVAIANHRITRLYRGVAPKVAPGARIDGRNGYLIPGLYDMHVHTAMGGRTRDEDVFGKILMPLFVAHGVTGVRDMGSDRARLRSWREDVRNGKLVGPRIWMAGEMIDGPMSSTGSTLKVSTPDEARQAVRTLSAGGVDFIKVLSGVGRDEYFAIADEARRENLTFAGHVPYVIGTEEASNAGQKSLEHDAGVLIATSAHEPELLRAFDAAAHTGKPEATLETALSSLPLALQTDNGRTHTLTATLVKNGTWLCPTTYWAHTSTRLSQQKFEPDESLLRFLPQYFRRQWIRYSAGLLAQGADPRYKENVFRIQELKDKLMSALHAGGVSFLAGTDTPAPLVLPGDSLLRELAEFPKLGFTPLQALQTATINPAVFLRIENEAGTIEPGKWADLVLLSANPLENIENIRRIEAVVLNGQYFDRARLDATLAGVASAAKEFDQNAGPADLGNDPARFDQRIDNAWLHHDVEFLRRTLAEDVVFSHAGGIVWNKQRWLDVAAAANAPLSARNVDAVEIEPHGDVIETIGHVQVKNNPPAKRSEYQVWYVRVYARQNGAWQLLSNRTVKELDGPLTGSAKFAP